MAQLGIEAKMGPLLWVLCRGLLNLHSHGKPDLRHGYFVQD